MTECCLQSARVSALITTAIMCEQWCDVNVETCAGYTFSGNVCQYCPVENFREPPNGNLGCITMTERGTGLEGENSKQCYANKCLACADGPLLNVTHNTTVLASKKCNRYVVPTDIDDAPIVSLSFAYVEGRPLTHTKVVGPLTVAASLPIDLGPGFQFLNNVHFRQCNFTGKVARAAITTSADELGTVIIEGRVEPHHARILFAANPSTSGGEILFGEGSSISSGERHSDFVDEYAVGLAALAHCTGSLNIACLSQNEYVVSQSLVGGTLFKEVQLTEACALVNVTDLLLDFGNEYEIEFFDGPPLSSPAVTVFNILLLATSITLLVTFIFHQTKLTAVHQIRKNAVAPKSINASS